MRNELIDGGDAPRRRGPRGQDVTPEMIETFLITLGMSCNVSMAAREAGFSQSWAYRLRKRDASFRRGWSEAIREGYAKLELVLLERVMKGTPLTLFRKDGSEKIVRHYDTPLAVALLRKHADTAAEANYEYDNDELAEVRDKILAKLERMRASEEGVLRDADPSTGSGAAPQDEPNSFDEADDTGIETKGIDRVGVIVWGLGLRSAPGLGRFRTDHSTILRMVPLPAKTRGGC